MSSQCSRCRERYPSPYYFLSEAPVAICLRCVEALPPQEQEELLQGAATAAGESVRRCLRCQTPMMRGDLAYRDQGGGDATTQVRAVKWAVARPERRFFGLLTSWVIDRSLLLDAWRCKECGYCELATSPDPPASPTPRGQTDPDDSTLL
jgi:rubrerythrin